jgi:hypothetical protein
MLMMVPFGGKGHFGELLAFSGVSWPPSGQQLLLAGIGGRP